MEKIKVGILGATGMVGQRFVQLLHKHPWFELVLLAASPNSAGKKYEEAVKGRWKMDSKIPEIVKDMEVLAVESDMEKIASSVRMVFSALDMDKEAIRRIEEKFAELGVAVISNNSAHRWTEDVPMLIPEVNADHLKLIDIQRENRGWEKGLIAVKPNCSIQSYVLILNALKSFRPKKVHVVSLQAISGAGKNFESWPEMIDNVIPLIPGEEEKSEKEPLKIWGELDGNILKPALGPEISATCIRVPVSDGHMACVSVSFDEKPSKEQILSAIKEYQNPLSGLDLPSAPEDIIHYFEEEDRPQTKLDRDLEGGMAVSMGRLREDKNFNWSFIGLSHNTLRGAAGGAVLMAELLVKKGYV